MCLWGIGTVPLPPILRCPPPGRPSRAVFSRGPLSRSPSTLAAVYQLSLSGVSRGSNGLSAVHHNLVMTQMVVIMKILHREPALLKSLTGNGLTDRPPQLSNDSDGDDYEEPAPRTGA
ncbi:hypothetical protein NDU88_001910 [Pleurodeles waltl]|uniref:Uncharacterized protein n=1 Tax=Pleurodeles waltl TaxID=8319 RepID=A0AAV7LB45_PLEWA|nr:hypothetical protein NDU88_001910 [Pleurodeles waltl]